jgi:hypothetical protein
MPLDTADALLDALRQARLLEPAQLDELACRPTAASPFPAAGAAFLPDGRHAISADVGGGVRLWRLP